MFCGAIAKSDELQLLHLAVSLRDALDSARVIEQVRHDHQLTQQPPGRKPLEHRPNACPLPKQKQKQNPATNGVEELGHHSQWKILYVAPLERHIAHLNIVVDVACATFHENLTPGNIVRHKPFGHQAAGRDRLPAAWLILKRADEQPLIVAPLPLLQRLFAALFSFSCCNARIVGDFAANNKQNTVVHEDLLCANLQQIRDFVSPEVVFLKTAVK